MSWIFQWAGVIGWLGFYASPKTELYVGVDPRKENHPIYEQQAQYYDSHLTFFETKKTPSFIKRLLRTLISVIIMIHLISYSHHHHILISKGMVRMIIRVG